MSWLMPPLPPKWEAALRDVRAQTLQARIAAAERLGYPEPLQLDAGVAALQTLVADVDARVRAAAVQSLAQLADARALPQLTAALEDSDGAVRELAVIALGRLPGEAALDAIVRATESAYPELRFQAIAAVVERAAARAEPILLRLLKDPEARVRASAAQAASSLDATQRTPALLRALGAALNDSDHHVRGEAALFCAELGDTRAYEPLLEALLDPELAVAALDAAPCLNDARLIERIVPIAQSVLRPRLVKAAAGRALVRMQDPRGVEALREVLLAFRGDGRTFAVETAGELGLQALAPVLAKLAKRPRGTDLLVLARALGQLGGVSPEAREALTRLALRDDEIGAQSHAELSRLDSSSRKSAEAPTKP